MKRGERVNKFSEQKAAQIVENVNGRERQQTKNVGHPFRQIFAAARQSCGGHITSCHRLAPALVLKRFSENRIVWLDNLSVLLTFASHVACL